MTSTLLYIVHDPAWKDCRVADAVRASGRQVEFLCPPAGDPLPETASYEALIVGGSAEGHADRPDELAWVADEIAYIRAAVDGGMPTLGICMGCQLLAAAYGGKVLARPDGFCELGFYPVEATAEGRGLFETRGHFYEAHYEGVVALPESAVLLARGERFPVQAFRIGERAYGTQFHPDMKLATLTRKAIETDVCMERPGAQPAQEQLRQAPLHEAAIQAWTERFVDRWLGHSADRAKAA